MGVALEVLSLESLSALDRGAAVKQFMRLLDQAQQDIHSRPGEKRPRKIQITLSLTPKVVVERDDDTGHAETILTGAAMAIHIDLKVPNRRTLEYDLGISANGAFMFNRDSPFDHRQPTLFDARDTVEARQDS